MNPRERFNAVARFREPDRPFLWGDGMWPETAARWREEGWDGRPFNQLFPEDPILQPPGEPRPISAGPWPPFERRVIDETDETVTYVDEDGIVRREFKGDKGWSSMPQFVKYPVETEGDFDKLARDRLAPKVEERLPGNWDDKVGEWKYRTAPLLYFAGRWGGFFGPLRNLVGIKRLCTLFYEKPEFVERMMDQRVEVLLAILGRILDDVDLDVFGFWEDMAYRTGPLLSPDMFREFMFPRYRIVCDYLRSRGVELICVDSDGDVRTLIPLWLKAGVNGIWPLEVQANMDVVELRRRYGRELVMIGGIDKRSLAKGRREIEAEVDRVWPVVETGGYFPHLDHSVPPDVSWENFCHYQRYRARKAGL